MNRLPPQPDRITSLNATAMDVIVVLSEGNPGAVTVLARIMEDDPMGILTILLFDTYNIYGSDIWTAYSDYAGKDISKLLKALKDSDLREKMVEVIMKNK